jgi:hypothetical protein
MSGVEGVNKRTNWQNPPPPQAHDNAQARQVLLVDAAGKPLLVREPRKVGFRKP